MTTTARLALVPRDGLFCKDGRGWHTSVSGRGHSLDWPWPSTVLGALRTAWGRAVESETGAAFDATAWRDRTAPVHLGRTIALRRPLGATWGTAHRLWPVPSDALFLEGSADVQPLEPERPILPTLGRGEDDAREALWAPKFDNPTKPLAPPRWWSEEHFATWLTGSSVRAHAPGKAFQTSRRVQAHVGIRPETLTADEGVLFSHDVVETLERDAEWAIGVEVELPEGHSPSIATLGSDGRIAQVEELAKDIFKPPPPVLDAFRPGSKGLRLVVVTPACFEAGWLPDGFDPQDSKFRGSLPGLDAELVLCAAFVPRPLHVSGWDMAERRPKQTSRMVPPGAVYFFERVDGEPFDANPASGLWLAALGTRTDQGFGRVVPGVWNSNRR